MSLTVELKLRLTLVFDLQKYHTVIFVWCMAPGA